MTTTTELGELTGDYLLDTAHTRIGFVARHTMATRVRGQFEEFEGSARLDGDDPSKSSARLTIQAKSLQTRNRQRDDQLRSTFLDTDDHPAITFTSTQVRQVDGTAFKVTGDLTIRGVTKPVTVDFELTRAANDPRGAFRVGFQGSVTINRMDWGVNWNAATGVLVSQKVTLEFDVAAIRRS
ncbi:YceI family protein [Nonomuraea sp. NBC_00507]|uniref:YceI family protein n=1 Tax=Nonomuraea sp. NBC_00507 TaxID=2976002 RepID=UPI002E18E5BC